MLVFFNLGFGQGDHQWYIAPLIMILPVILQILLQSGSSTWVYDNGSWRQDTIPNVGSFTSIISLIVPAMMAAALVIIVLTIKREGAGPALRRIFLTGFRGGGGGAARNHQYGSQSKKERFEAVASIIQSLPTELFKTKEELESLSISELKSLLSEQSKHQQQGSSPLQNRDNPAVVVLLEKRDLIDKLMSTGGSSASSCGICCDDYQSGDVLRVLTCCHRFHLECVDKWFLSSTDYSRPVACPLCNLDLEKKKGQQQQQQ